LLIQATNKQGAVIAQFESSEFRNWATSDAIARCYKLGISFFAIYVDGKLDCYSESSDRFQFPKTI
jgi:hypothetical protein